MVTERLIVALDVPSAEEAVRLAKRVAPAVAGFKVGLELLSGPGPATVAAVAEIGNPVFVDAKLHDIPATVRRAARALAGFGGRWLTVHALGGKAMLEAAIEGFGSGVVAVTVLTSLDATTLTETGITRSPGKLVSRLARLAAQTGCEGVVCSVQELGVVAEVASDLATFTPGIRPHDGGRDDQRRVATPEEALRRGADYLIVGRPITRAKDPLEAAIALASW
jgi:orotidine-5'-phosphate decarboxylase